MKTTTFTAKVLSRFATQVYTALGLSETDAVFLADTLVQADLWGHQSHGIMRTFWYTARLQSGATNYPSEPMTVIDGGAIAVIDGNHSIGQLIAQEAMREAIKRAKVHGIGAVAVRNSGHFGTAMYYTRQAAQEGCIGFLSTNASPAMAPWGGREKLIGTNPWSIAAPAGRYPPMLLDVANTAVARGKLYVAKQRGESIPLGWAIDGEGIPTTDPAEGILGNILPFAAHKGYAIATMMDVLSGILSGSAFTDDVVGPYTKEGNSGVGHLALALDIAAFRDLADFNRDMETLIEKIKENEPMPDVEEVFYPGEMEAQAEQRQLISGIEIPHKTVVELDNAAQALGCRTLAGIRDFSNA